MSNAKSMTTGGANSTIDPMLMRKATPLSTQMTQDIAYFRSRKLLGIPTWGIIWKQVLVQFR